MTQPDDRSWVVICTLTEKPLLDRQGQPQRFTEAAARAEAQRMAVQMASMGMGDIGYRVERI